MKFNFKIQQYQTDAVNAVCNVFVGQGFYSETRFKHDLGVVRQDSQSQTTLAYGTEYIDEISDIGYKNEAITLTDEQLLKNIHTQQNANNLKLAESLNKDLGRCSLDIEMETGTGKTYCYIKTMFELNKHYGWSKFIVVVPSIAIREGVKKSFEITQEHFMEHFGKKARFFIYNSKNLTQLDNFATDSGINVMIINTQAFAASLNEDKNVEGRSGNAEARIIYSKRDEFSSRRPIDVIAANNPIVILDEPQKMQGDVTQKALKKFNPLFSLNYSATHSKQHNLIYALDALDAYNQKLVKKIEVKGFEVKNLRGTGEYLFLERIVLSKNKPPMARIELEVKYKNGIKREIKNFGVGDNLYLTSNGLPQYDGYVVSEVNPFNGGSVTFLNGVTLNTGNVQGDVSEDTVRRIQIRETIISHFEKEEKLFNKGIKTLSLFFIDKVDNYRQYDEEGNAVLGDYGKVFEEEYVRELGKRLQVLDTPYQKYLREKCNDASIAHNGYFSIDKKGRVVDSSLKRGSDSSDDISAYDLIMKNKERLLSFDEPTRFIFSHSALREGWDNPNIFQICTLKRSESTTNKRQEVGRGLRLCVAQDGSRMDEEVCGISVHDTNMLTVIASESYKEFVDKLQKETVAEGLSDRPKKADEEYFVGKTIIIQDKPVSISKEQARKIHNYLVRNNYIDDDDKVTDDYKTAVANSTLAEMSEELRPLAAGVHQLVQAIFDESALRNMISNGHDTKVERNDLNTNFYRKEFQELWQRIQHKYAYTVSFDSSELIAKAVNAIDTKLFVAELQYTRIVGRQNDSISVSEMERSASFGATQSKTETITYIEDNGIKYDLVGKIAAATNLTRRTVAKILKSIEQPKLYMFKYNPEEFIIKVSKLINEQKATMVVEHVTYNKLEECHETSIFTEDGGQRNFAKAFKATKHVQDYVFTDGSAERSVERRFAEDLDGAEEVCVYAKLPRGFAIPTPVGNYSPDWAIAFNKGTVKHIFFIAETKGTMETLNLRPVEQAKIKCAKKLFNELSDKDVIYDYVDSYGALLDIMNK